ncbi:MAG: cytochrome c5 family protein [Betaproteobacteria bacterium]|nr:MAG: cytochrome c5 family protein [Betaproteobacteria bacterium]
MSDANHSHDHEGPHAGPIKTPRQLIVAVFFAFVVPIIAIVLLVSFVAADKQPAAGTNALAAEAVARRIAPVGHVEVKDLSDPSSMKTGDQVYAAQCVACHGTGVAGAPKFGDAAAWGPRIGQGYETLLTHALKGKGAMAPQGGGDFSDLEIGRAVVYMANKGGAKLEEPKLPAGTVAKADEAASAPVAVAAAITPAPAATPAPTAAVAKADSGAAPPLYAQTCSACHAAGVAGAPKLGDKAAWAPRLGQGIDALTATVIKGKGAMPPKGGSGASEAEIKTAVAYMVKSAK